MNEPYRLRYANQIVGAFLLIVLAIAIALTTLLLKAGDFFTDRDAYFFEVKQSELQDLRRGAEVTMLGERVGEIESITYVDDTEMVRVLMAIEPNKSNQIFESSVVVPTRKYGLGAPILDIRRSGAGDRSQTRLPPGSAIEILGDESDRVDQVAQEVKSVSESIRRIEEKLNPTLTTVDSAAGEFESSLLKGVNPSLEKASAAAVSLEQTSEALRPDVQRTLASVRDATDKLENQVADLTDRIERLVDEDVTETLGKVQASTDSVSAAAKDVKKTSTEANAALKETLLQVQEAALAVQRLAEQTQEVVKVVQGEANDLPGTTSRVNNTVSDTQDLVEEIRGHWLLRRSGSRDAPTTISPANVRGGFAR